MKQANKHKLQKQNFKQLNTISRNLGLTECLSLVQRLEEE